MSSPRPSSGSSFSHLSATDNGSKDIKSHPSSRSGARPQSATVDKTQVRASLDAARGGVATATGLGFGRSPGGQRPVSEMLKERPMSEWLANAQGNTDQDSPESKAIDQWFEDLQHYQTTLEDMTAASLDQNFKEELSAIEQWFQVLSEPERTAALYSLIQSSTPVQIRFFITVLQQMCGDQPNAASAALMSPNNPQTAGFEAQMEAKLSQLGFKAPAASPAAKQFARLNMSAPDSNNNNSGSDLLTPQAAADNAAATLAQQRARLNKSAAHRISAPGTLSANYNGSGEPKSAGLWTQNEVNERRSPSPSGGQRPKSTGSDLGGGGNNSNNMMRSPNMNQNNLLDESFSPMVGNWASQVNTPLVPMFSEPEHQSPSLDMSNASSKLASWGAQHQNAGNNVATGKDPSVVQLDDAKKFRRSGRIGPDSLGAPQQQQGAPGPRRSTSGGFGNPPASPSASSQQAAVAAQTNWRNTNGLSPNLSGGMSAGGLNTGNMTPQEITSALMQQQSMMQAQLQLQQNLLMMNGLMSPNMGGQAPGFNPLSPLMSSGSQSTWGAKPRSPRPSGTNPHGNRTPSSASHVAGTGANPDEQVDLALLKDIPAWLRSLRLHKYTPTFEKYKWEDMIQMDDAALEKVGVSALGARRKLLKVFQNVRVSLGMEERKPEDPNADQSADLTADMTDMTINESSDSADTKATAIEADNSTDAAK